MPEPPKNLTPARCTCGRTSPQTPPPVGKSGRQDQDPSPAARSRAGLALNPALWHAFVPEGRGVGSGGKQGEDRI